MTHNFGELAEIKNIYRREEKTQFFKKYLAQNKFETGKLRIGFDFVQDQTSYSRSKINKLEIYMENNVILIAFYSNKLNLRYQV